MEALESYLILCQSYPFVVAVKRRRAASNLAMLVVLDSVGLTTFWHGGSREPQRCVVLLLKVDLDLIVMYQVEPISLAFFPEVGRVEKTVTVS